MYSICIVQRFKPQGRRFIKFLYYYYYNWAGQTQYSVHKPKLLQKMNERLWEIEPKSIWVSTSKVPYHKTRLAHSFKSSHDAHSIDAEVTDRQKHTCTQNPKQYTFRLAPCGEGPFNWWKLSTEGSETPAIAASPQPIWQSDDKATVTTVTVIRTRKVAWYYDHRNV